MGFRDYVINEDTRVGRTIISQINALDKWAMWSWGAKNIVVSDEGVKFDVRGSKFKGKVIITLDRGKDLYNIEFGQIRNLDWKSKKTIKRVGVENLVSVIDDYVG